MIRRNAIRNQWPVWALILGMWALLLLAFAGQLMFTSGLDWRLALTLAGRDWLPWALLAPAVAWLAFRFPLERQELALSIPVHVAACMLAVVACELVARPLPSPPLPPRGAPSPGLPGPAFRYRGGVPQEQLPPRASEPGFVPPEAPLFGPPATTPRQVLFMDALVMRAKFNIPVYWIVVSIVHAFMFYRRLQERERRTLELETTLTEAKLQALRMQLHPHFLFNTLNAISTLLHKDPHAADEMISNLGELLRATLDLSSQEITLEQELRLLDRYLDIQQARFGNRLRVARHIDPAALSGRVPTLILQPLVENAIRHGLEPTSAPGLLEIEARVRGDQLRLAIRDNGAGPNQAGDSREGIGLANTRSRLLELYGAKARFSLAGGTDGGCSAEIELPFHEQPINPETEPQPA